VPKVASRHVAAVDKVLPNKALACSATSASWAILSTWSPPSLSANRNEALQFVGEQLLLHSEEVICEGQAFTHSMRVASCLRIRFEFLGVTLNEGRLFAFTWRDQGALDQTGRSGQRKTIRWWSVGFSDSVSSTDYMDLLPSRGTSQSVMTSA